MTSSLLQKNIMTSRVASQLVHLVTKKSIKNMYVNLVGHSYLMIVNSWFNIIVNITKPT